MPFGGDNPQLGDGGSRVSSTQLGGIVEATMGNICQPVVLWNRDFVDTHNWHPDSPCLGGGLPSQVGGCACMPEGWIWNGITWLPVWNGSGNTMAHGWEEHVADNLPHSW
jgi:hypothetical protein